MSRNLPPTATRLREFRERGDIARSRDAVAAAALAGATAALLCTAPQSFAALRALTDAAVRDASAGGAHRLAGPAVAVAAQATAPVLVGAAAAALVAIGVQLGWPPALRWGRRGGATQRQAAPPSPSALRQALAPAAVARRAAAALGKLAALVAVLALALSPRALAISSAPQLRDAVAATGRLALLVGAVAFAALGALDYALARWRQDERLKMTHEELRREQREHEGDPAMKARRQRQRNDLARAGRAGLAEPRR